jgi:uncharacterized membrane protein YjdF
VLHNNIVLWSSRPLSNKALFYFALKRVNVNFTFSFFWLLLSSLGAFYCVACVKLACLGLLVQYWDGTEKEVDYDSKSNKFASSLVGEGEGDKCGKGYFVK